MDEAKRQAVELFKEGRKAYKLMEFQTARQYFVQALEVCPDDGPSEVFLKRCDEFIATPPDDDWDGVYDAKEK
jgi:hypothetical protein